MGKEQKELELKLILQKNFFDDRMIWATNIETAIEKDTAGAEVEKATELNLQTGVSYRFMPNWSAGVELRNHHEFSGYGYRNHEHSAWFFGPSVHYATKNWWMNVAWRAQMPWVKTFKDEQLEVVLGGRIYGGEHARNEFAINFGVPF
ncbi:MAG: transporter [Candidatus Protistobacter heckmanni]|nr:transporter [Candidatus Protistobacter heckmanni]